MRLLCLRVLGQAIRQEAPPLEYGLNPPNAAECVLHWKITALLLAKAPLAKRIEFANMNCPLLLHPLDSTTIDSHLHLDKVLTRRNISRLEDLTTQCSGGSTIRISRFLMSLNFRDGLRWFLPLLVYSQLDFTIGLHPHQVSERPPSSGLWHEMEEMIRHPRCVAVGEVGLDYNTHPRASDRRNQASYLRRIAALARTISKPVVIHCRPDKDPDQARRDCIEVLRKELPAEHAVYVHCFSDELLGLEEWRRAFLKVYVGL